MTDTTHSTISLTWTAPANNGGSPIIGYLVECKRTDTSDWIRCNVPRNLQETNYIIQNLIDKSEYQCRITAVNKVGFSEPAEVPGKHVAKDIVGMYILDFPRCLHVFVVEVIKSRTNWNQCHNLDKVLYTNSDSSDS